MEPLKFKYILQSSFSKDDRSWNYTVPALPVLRNGLSLVKHISMVSNSEKHYMMLDFQKPPPNRAISEDPLDRFIMLSVGDFRLRQPSKCEPSETEPATARDSADYIVDMLKTGIRINDVTYNFYGHSNSQLKSRSCYLYADSKSSIASKIESQGDFSGCKTVAKKAKRIGLLFSQADAVMHLPAERCKDIEDVEVGDYNFTDGCGLISVSLANILRQKLHLHFRNCSYIPSVFQIRYKGYKGVLEVHPPLTGKTWVEFRRSMRKFKDCQDSSLSIVDYSKPLGYGFLNDEIVVLLNTLGISTEVFLHKQAGHFGFLRSANTLEPRSAFQFLLYRNQMDSAEKLLIHGVEYVKVELRKLISQEISRTWSKKKEQKCRILVQKSRLLFGVCDPLDVLKEGECFLRIRIDSDVTPRTITGTEIMVTRNPCLHPGDIQKFKAVDKFELSHLSDCIVFPTHGQRPSTDLMSGGDLDGDKFFVCWDADLIPSSISEPAEYPAPKEPVTFGAVTDDQRIEYFARYTSASLGRVKALHTAWAQAKGCMSAECQQLNRLYSQCVDGKSIKVPSHLEQVPHGPLPAPGFILDVLHDAATSELGSWDLNSIDCAQLSFDAMSVLLSRNDFTLSEADLIRMIYSWCITKHVDFTSFLMFIDFRLLHDQDKHWILSKLPATRVSPSIAFNGLMQSSLLTSAEVKSVGLHESNLRWKQVFSSEIERMAILLNKISSVSSLFDKKFILLHISDRLTIGVFIPSRIGLSQDTRVGASVRVFAFLHTQDRAGRNVRQIVPTKSNSYLFCDQANFQLFDGKRANTFIFLTRGGANDSKYRNISGVGDRRRMRQETVEAGENTDCRASVALDKISKPVQSHVGRVNRDGVIGAEIYVISNRDVEAIRAVDKWLELVDTDCVLPLFERQPREYAIPQLTNLDITQAPDTLKALLEGEFQGISYQLLTRDLKQCLETLLRKEAVSDLRRIYTGLLNYYGDAEVHDEDGAVGACLLQALHKVPFLTHVFFTSMYWKKEQQSLQRELDVESHRLLCSIIMSGSTIEELTLQPFDLVLTNLRELSPKTTVALAEVLSLTLQSTDVALDLFLTKLMPHARKLLPGQAQLMDMFLKYVAGIALDHIQEGNESARTFSNLVELKHETELEGCLICRCDIRIDAPRADNLRTGDHVRLMSIGSPTNAKDHPRFIMNAIVENSEQGRAFLRCISRPPVYYEECSWSVTQHGSFATTRAMFEAVRALYTEQEEACAIASCLLERSYGNSETATTSLNTDQGLNESQAHAVDTALQSPVTVIWGPPGTGKTQTVVSILYQILRRDPKKRIICTAPTHNAVDNIMRRFMENHGDGLPQNHTIRVATDVRRISDDLQRYTCDANLGKESNDGWRTWKKAQQMIKRAKMVFSTCVGAGLGLLASEKFEVVLIDEASQLVEPAALVPLVKGCEKAVLVGDHVQLRATVQSLSTTVEFDISLFERLHVGSNQVGIRKVLLDTQYRMTEDLCDFSSQEFYQGKLQTCVSDVARPLPQSDLKWPHNEATGKIARRLFFQCLGKEDMGRKSKANSAQATLCQQICERLLKTESSYSVAVLTPYSRQVDMMSNMLPSGVQVSSIDAFQGKEADVVVFVTVRSNLRRSIGFLTDMRRLNVALTRARSGFILIGDRETLTQADDETSADTWDRLIQSCTLASLSPNGT